MDRLDVAIVGAGPPGCRAAFRMAGAGARVAILDGSHPREKPCGGGVTGRALDLVRDAIDPLDLGAVPIETAVFEHDARRISMSIGGTAQPVRLAQSDPLAQDRPLRLTQSDPQSHPLAQDRLVVVSRRDFDGALLAAACRAGAHLIDARVTDVTPHGDGWVIVTRGGVLSAGWLLGADGPNSLVRRRVLRPFDRADLSIATGFFVHGPTSREIAIAFEARPFDSAQGRPSDSAQGMPAGYLWAFPRRDHVAVGVCAQADASSSATLLSSASRWISRNVEGPVELVRYSWPIPSLRVATLQREQPAGPRWMLLGDAGGMVDPITREGIYFALLSADTAADCLAGGGDPPAQYSRRIRRSIHAELIRAARLKNRFFAPRFTGLMIHALQRSPAIRHVMCDLIAGRQTYRGLRRRLLGTLEVRLMFDVLFGT
jgi:flavin-dependent dehydrogenase